MPGYLDQYGAGEERRNRIIIRSIIAAAVIVLVSGLTWYLLRNHHQESVVKQFAHALHTGDYQSAYRIWGCTAEKPCTSYSFNNFMEDWGSKTPAADSGALRITDSESCSSGVLLTVSVTPSRQEKLWVDKGNDAISFAPYPVCPHKNPFAIMLHRTLGQLRKPLLN